MKSMLTKTILAGALGVMFATGALAGAADDIVNARQACMKAQGGGVFGLMFPILKGEKPYDAAAITAAMDKMGAACADWANFWPESAMQGETVKSRAKPEIWTDKAGFEAAGGASYTAMTALRATTDEASFKAALPAVGAACQGCHEKFQAPKE